MTEQSIVNKTICKVAYKTHSTIMNIGLNPRSKIMLFFGLMFVFLPISGMFDPKLNFNFLNVIIFIFSLITGIIIMSLFIFNRISLLEFITKNKMVRIISMSILLLMVISMLFLFYKQCGISSLIKIGIWTTVGIIITMSLAYGLVYVLSKCPKLNKGV